MSRDQLHKSISILNNETDSVDWSSISDSNYENSTRPSADDNLLSDSAALAFQTVFEPSINIVGRSKEISVLEDAFYSLCHHHQLEGGKSSTMTELKLSQKSIANYSVSNCPIVLVHGVSGSGKTSLVEQSLRHVTTESNGFFVTGKYEANAGVREPHAAILEAFSDLCDLTIQSSDFMLRKRDIQLALGRPSAQLLEKAVSNLKPLLENNLEGPSESGIENDHHHDNDNNEFLSHERNASAFAKFMVACKSFLKAMSSKDHPIVLFIDDIQWMDDGSRQLLSFLLNDQELTNIMVVLAYRDEERSWIADFLHEANSYPNVLDIGLHNLESEAVHRLVSEIIGSKTSSTEELSNIIAAKTRGNPFHVVQFLEAIQREGLMTYNIDASEWHFDVDEIQREIMVSETLADLLALRVRRLPMNVQQSLKIASLLGYRFDQTLVNQIASSLLNSNDQNKMDTTTVVTTAALSLDSITSSLNEAKKEGFIEKTKDGYQFSHDKLQMAFASMIDEVQKDRYHLIIGKAYLANESPESMYHAAVHLHQAPSHMNEGISPIDLAHIDLQAAKYCKEMGAFNDAAILLKRGLELLHPEEKWTKHYDLTFELTETLSKMELIIGNHESCKEKAREALLQAKTTKMKINALMIDVECCMTCNEMEGTTSAANRALGVLGIQMPRKVTFRHVLAKLMKVKIMIGRKSDEYILSLPTMKDESMATAVRLLLHLYMYCFLKDEDLQAVYSALLATEITLKGGLNPYAASAFTIYGVAELSNGDYRRAYRFGKLALSLLDRFKNRDAECATTGLALTLLTHWYDPVREMPSKLLQAANRGFEIGDVVYGTFCLSMCYGMQVLLGDNLEQLEAFMWSTYQRIRDLSQDAMIMWAQAAIQYVLNLRNEEVDDWKDLTNLTGDVMNEEEYMQQALEANHPILIMIAWSYKAQLSCLFGQWAKSESIYRNMMDMGESFHFSYGVMPCSFFGGIASYSLYKETKNRKHLKFARKNQETLRRAQSRGCPNSSAFLALLKAEELSIKKSAKPKLVSTAFDFAIEKTASEKLPHIEALANERAAFYQVKCKNREPAERYLNRALEVYKHEWGAVAKHDWLVDRMEKELSTLPFEYTSNAVTGNMLVITNGK